jgi:hypothetical protein
MIRVLLCARNPSNNFTRHHGQRKIGISKLAGISIREVARELEEDMDLDS